VPPLVPVRRVGHSPVAGFFVVFQDDLLVEIAQVAERHDGIGTGLLVFTGEAGRLSYVKDGVQQASRFGAVLVFLCHLYDNLKTGDWMRAVEKNVRRAGLAA
jgi:hypothetical protein